VQKNILSRFNREGDKFLNRIITGNEMWVHYSEPETKAQSKQWKRAGSQPPKKFKMSPSAGKVMLVAFWDSRGMILTHFMPIGQTVIAKYYSEVILKNHREKLKQMRPRLAQKNVLLLHDNAPSHTAAATVEVTNGNCCLTLLIAQTSPPVTYLFPELKKLLAGKKYKTRAALITQFLKHRSMSWFTVGIQKLPRRWQKCVDVGGEYFEKE
jgi:histone-lysine N-methyltransferase SETMAR